METEQNARLRLFVLVYGGVTSSGNFQISATTTNFHKYLKFDSNQGPHNPHDPSYGLSTIMPRSYIYVHYKRKKKIMLESRMMTRRRIASASINI